HAPWGHRCLSSQAGSDDRRCPGKGQVGPPLDPDRGIGLRDSDQQGNSRERTVTGPTHWQLRGLLTAAIIAYGLGAPVARGQEPRYGTETAAQPSRFEVGDSADQGLRALWEASSAAGAERVACIGGERRNGVGRITRVLALDSARSDSLAVSASAS